MEIYSYTMLRPTIKVSGEKPKFWQPYPASLSKSALVWSRIGRKGIFACLLFYHLFLGIFLTSLGL